MHIFFTMKLFVFILFSVLCLINAQYVERENSSSIVGRCKQRNCPPNRPFFNWETCICECRPELFRCIPGFIFNERRCRCVREKVCRRPQNCRGNRILNPRTCSCECDLSLIDCPEDSIVNPKTCDCEFVCPDVICMRNFVLDQRNCKCKCDTSQVVCTADSYLDLKTCTCVKLTPPCPPQNCGINPKFQLNLETCQCECPPENCGISPFYVWNNLTCECECPPRNCGINPIIIWNNDTCQCECDPSQIVCTAGYYLDLGTCSCVQLSPPCRLLDCGIIPDYVWNPKTCDCECAKKCEPPSFLDSDICQCFSSLNF